MATAFELLTGLADAIRAKTGSSDKMGIEAMTAAVTGLPVGGGDSADGTVFEWLEVVTANISDKEVANVINLTTHTDETPNFVIALPFNTGYTAVQTRGIALGVYTPSFASFYGKKGIWYFDGNATTLTRYSETGVTVDVGSVRLVGSYNQPLASKYWVLIVGKTLIT